MPIFLIEDLDTGFKLQVAGDQPPSEDEAHELTEGVKKELLAGLVIGEGNRIMLDVGPTAENRSIGDKMVEIRNGLNKLIAQADTMLNKQKGLPPVEPEVELSVTDKIMRGMPPNTLLLNLHGKESGGFASDAGTELTIGNIAAVLKERVPNVNNVINMACFGGKATPEQFQQHFPALTNLVQTDSRKVNTISAKGVSEQSYFGLDMRPDVWQRQGTNWISGNLPQKEYE